MYFTALSSNDARRLALQRNVDGDARTQQPRLLLAKRRHLCQQRNIVDVGKCLVELHCQRREVV
jgi:hypothetical protein